MALCLDYNVVAQAFNCSSQLSHCRFKLGDFALELNNELVVNLSIVVMVLNSSLDNVSLQLSTSVSNSPVPEVDIP